MVLDSTDIWQKLCLDMLSHYTGLSDFQFMKNQIAIGTVGKPGYRNINFGLCRILISTIDAPFLFDLLSAGVTDAYWDITTIQYYARYVSENVFAPMGVTSALDHAGTMHSPTRIRPVCPVGVQATFRR